ncbi:MAG TPA: choice-of-anchor tandem repeat NxxGxxAF-containing protein [Tepidisphaeraceae bacterium]|nr:choice-of-anchor tandem repeat NxxGxxAF-containing protein [Tepidisphaeraceae bacterium]
MWRPAPAHADRPAFALAALLVTAAVSAAPAAGQSLPTRPVVLSGQAAPGTGATYARLGTASINNSGQVRFDATVAGPSVTPADDSAAFLGPAVGGGGPQLLAREGQPAPGIAGSVLGELFFVPHAVTPQGQSLVSGELRTGGAPDGRAYFGGTPGDLRLVYRPGPFEVVHGNPAVGAGPRAVLWTQGRGIVHWDGTTTSTVATPGEYFQPTLNGAGRIAFTAYNTDVETQAPGLYAGTGAGDFRPVAVRGAASPGLPAGHAFDLVLDASQNDAGGFAFIASARSDTPESYTWGLWAGRPGELRLLARDGQPAPGLPAGLRFERVLFDIDSTTRVPIGAAGHVTFWAALEDEAGAYQGTSAWLALPDGGTALLARRGDPVTTPLPGGGTAQLTVGRIEHDAMWVNGAGQVVLFAETLAPGEEFAPDSLLAAGPGGALHLIARPGLPFEVAPGDVRTVSDVSAGTGGGTGGQDGLPSPFNDAGQFVYRLSFTDGTSGLFLTTVPEPGTAGVVGLLAAVALAVRRCRCRRMKGFWNPRSIAIRDRGFQVVLIQRRPLAASLAVGEIRA